MKLKYIVCSALLFTLMSSSLMAAAAATGERAEGNPRQVAAGRDQDRLEYESEKTKHFFRECDIKSPPFEIYCDYKNCRRDIEALRDNVLAVWERGKREEVSRVTDLLQARFNQLPEGDEERLRLQDEITRQDTELDQLIKDMKEKSRSHFQKIDSMRVWRHQRAELLEPVAGRQPDAMLEVNLLRGLSETAQECEQKQAQKIQQYEQDYEKNLQEIKQVEGMDAILQRMEELHTWLKGECGPWEEDDEPPLDDDELKAYRGVQEGGIFSFCREDSVFK